MPDGLIRAAGVLLIHQAPGGDRALFVRHAERGTWEFPGGVVEEGETAQEAAERELLEEVGPAPYGRLTPFTRNQLAEVDFTTFQARVADAFEPVLSEEHTDWQWANLDTPPDPLHPGVRLALDRLQMNELDIARAIADGRLSSPQQYENLWLFALRITGTGASYRPEYNEHVWRDPGIYLNPEFLARCNGMLVIWEHPPGDQLNQKEFRRRIIGSIMLPYLMDDEVWGIAKLYDQDAVQIMLDNQLSTSPAVSFPPGVNREKKLDGDRTLLIEGVPKLVDHLAVCELGVWDKYGDPTGVAMGEPERAEGPADMLPEDASINRLDAIVADLSRVIDLI